MSDVAFHAIGQVLVGWLLADSLSGVGHWFEDRIGKETWPVIGRHVIVPNRHHHLEPLACTRSSFVERNWITWSIVAVAGSALLIVVGPATWVVTAMTGGMLINEAHVWAHRPATAPAWIEVLQGAGVFQSPQHHARHHRGAHDRNYCILSNFLNPALDRFRVWHGLEAALVACGVHVGTGRK